jgi:predicted DNA-binding transcriptional regulator YafY
VPDAAQARLARIVSLVAELTRAEHQGAEPPRIEELAQSFGVSPQDIALDIRTLTLLGEHADAEWLLSLGVWQQEDRVAITSSGPFRRPIRLTPDEMLAVQVALAMDPEGLAIARKLAPLMTMTAPRPALAAASTATDRYQMIVDAIAARFEVELLYAGEGERAGRRWVIQPHQLVGWRGRTYIIAWCDAVADWRHFRLDRIIDALVRRKRFAPQADFRPVTDPAALFHPADATADRVRVRFSADVSRWVRERYPQGEPQADGAVIVSFTASSMDWLVRRVLEYGPDAEVIEPEAYREAVRRAVA